MTKTSERSLRPWLSEAGGRCPEGTPFGACLTSVFRPRWLWVLLFAGLAVGQELALKTLQVPAPGASKLEVATGIRLTIPAKHGLAFASLGRWNPGLEGSAGLATSSFGGHGVSTVDFLAGRYALGDHFSGAPDKPFIAPKLPFFALLVRDTQPKDPKNPTIKTITDGWGWCPAPDAAERRVELLINDQPGEFYNNTGDLLVVYAIVASNALPWGISASDFRRAEHLDADPSAVRDPSGLVFDWEIIRFNPYLYKNTGGFVYELLFRNSGSSAVDRRVWFRDNKGNQDSVSVSLVSGGTKSGNLSFPGMNITSYAIVEHGPPDVWIELQK